MGRTTITPWRTYLFNHSKSEKTPNVEITRDRPPIFAPGSLLSVPPTTHTSWRIFAFGPRVAEPRITAVFPSTLPSTLAEPATTTRLPITWPLIVALPETTDRKSVV